MEKAIITYETQHGSAKKIAEVLSEKLGVKMINVDTPFEAENLSDIDNIIMVFNFRGPYTAQLTKLYLERVKDQMKNKRLILVGEGIFSEKEFPVVAEEIAKIAAPAEFLKFFVPGQLRIEILFPEEKVLLKKFSENTGMEIKDMGELDLVRAEEVAAEILEKCAAPIATTEKTEEVEKNEETGDQWVCSLCGYVHTGPNPPEKCPLCGAPASAFKKK